MNLATELRRNRVQQRTIRQSVSLVVSKKRESTRRAATGETNQAPMHRYTLGLVSAMQ